jgi:hypothetical protein
MNERYAAVGFFDQDNDYRWRIYDAQGGYVREPLNTAEPVSGPAESAWRTADSEYAFSLAADLNDPYILGPDWAEVKAVFCEDCGQVWTAVAYCGCGS